MNQNFIVSSEYEEEISQDASKVSNNPDSKRTISTGSNCKELDLLIQGEEYSLVNENVTIKVQSPVNEKSKISLNSNRLSYLNSLLEVDTVNNSTSTLNLSKMSSKITKYVMS